jgi:uncharacterized protein HemY
LLESALRAEPENTVLLTCLGAVYRDQGFHAKAHETLKKAIDLGLRDKHTFFNRAVAVMNMGKSKSAARFFEKAAELIPSPETWEAYFDPLSH